MDGNAESYLLYGFIHMQGITCTSGDKKFVIDVSEMQDPDLAYGMFSSNADPNAPIAKIAMGGQIQPRRASFAKGKFYVEIAASPEGDHTAALQAFISKIEPLIEGRNTPPDALSWFPQENLVSVRLIPESVLGLRQLKRGYVAKYTQGQAFIVIESSPESASAVFQKLRARFSDASPCSGRSLDRQSSAAASARHLRFCSGRSLDRPSESASAGAPPSRLEGGLLALSSGWPILSRCLRKGGFSGFSFRGSELQLRHQPDTHSQVGGPGLQPRTQSTPEEMLSPTDGGPWFSPALFHPSTFRLFPSSTLPLSHSNSASKLWDEAFQAQSPYLDHLCIFRKGRYIAGYANQPSPESALTNATNLASHLP